MHIFYTEKNIISLSQNESDNLKKRLLQDVYIELDGVYISKRKYNDYREKRIVAEIFEKEFEACKILFRFGHKVYLLQEKYSKGKHADAIVDNEFTELKQCDSEKKIGANYADGRNQGVNVFINIKPDISIENAKRQIRGKIKLKRKLGLPTFGKIYLYFSKTNELITLENK